jgi:hypothetical protein
MLYDDGNDDAPVTPLGEADKPGVRCAFSHLGCTCLTPDRNSRDARCLGIPMFDRPGHEFMQGSRCFLVEGASPNAWLAMPNDCSSRVTRLLHEIRFRKRSISYDTSNDQSHLERSHEQLSLSERCLGQSSRCAEEIRRVGQSTDRDG